ncbi:MAG: TldD/PmbA family protein [Pseudomonadota bacterium]
MKNVFYNSCNFLDTKIQSGEHYLAWFEGERSDFVRFNHAVVRQAGSVMQMSIEVRLITGNRHAATKIGLSGDDAIDKVALETLIDRLREVLPTLPDDPFLLYSDNAEKSEFVRDATLPSGENAIGEITDAARGTDLVGIHASGPIYRGFGNSFGARRWHETQSFNFDFSLYLSGDKAVKSEYAGFEWDTTGLTNVIDRAKGQLALLLRSSRTLEPGKYRVYLTPSALGEITTMLAWGGFGLKAQRTRQSPLLRLLQGDASLSKQLTIMENTATGIAANFESQGFSKPPAVPLITEGKINSALVSPRSAKEFGIATNGANAGETPEALEVAAGNLSSTEILKQLGTGIYVNNLWYLNFSDRSAGRITGMTRFATFWVENGEIVAPMNVMRFDESIYRMLGDNLEALSKEREYLVDPGSYGARSTQSWHLPGALVRDFTLTL